MANILPWIVALTLSSFAYSQNDYKCGYRATDGTGRFTFEEKELNDGEFTVGFKVLANSDVRIILSPEKEENNAAYIITIGERNELTTIARFGGEVLATYTVTTASPFRESELRCYDNCMNSYWICFQSGMIKVGRGGDSAPYFEYNVPAGETFNPRHVGFSTGSSSIGLFGDFSFDNTCRNQGSGSDVQTTTRPPRCRPLECGALTCTRFGYKQQDGCDICECKETPCEVLSCDPCKHGYAEDMYYCDTCTCNPGPCDQEPCNDRGYCYGAGVGRTDYGCMCDEGYEGKNCEKDVQNPNITCPSDMTLKTDPGSNSASIIYPPATATDNSGQEPNIDCLPNSSTLPVGLNTIQCIATDGSDNTDSCTYVITVNDEEPPTPKCPIPMDEPYPTDVNEPYATVNYELPAIEDNSDPKPDFTCDKTQEYEFPVGPTEVTCTASDKYENSDTCSFSVVVEDQELPVFKCPLPMENVPVDGGEDYAVVDYVLPSVTDNVDPDIKVTCVEPSGSKFPTGRSNVTCTATDTAGNSKDCSFPVVVKDNEAPTITCPKNMRKNTDDGKPFATVTYETPEAQDNSDPNPAVVCEPPSNSKFWILPIPNQVTCTARDSNGNTNSCEFFIEVIDEEKPTIICPESMDDVVTDKGKNIASVFLNPPIISDNEDEYPEIVCDIPAFAEFKIGETTVPCTVTDRSLNSADCSFKITVRDNEKPTIVCPVDMPGVLTDEGEPTATVDYGVATASDNADPDVAIVCIPAVNFKFPIGPTTVKCTATDDAGNQNICPFVVTVSDKEKPKLECPVRMDKTTDLGKPFATVDYVVPTAEDNVDDNLDVTCSDLPNSEFSLGPTTVECNTVDNANNEDSCTFVIDVKDDEKPGVKCPSPMLVPVDPGEDYATVKYVQAIVTDNVEPLPVAVCSPKSESQFQLDTTVVTCTAIDDAENQNDCTFTITVEDKEGPTIECPLPMPEPADFGSRTTTVVYKDPEVFDNTDDNPTVSCTPASNTVFTIGITNVTCTALDDAGNTNECLFPVEVRDTEAPEFTCPTPMLEDMDPGESFATVSYDIPTASDNWDDEVLVVCAPVPNTRFNAGIKSVVCSVVDKARNKNNCTFDIEVQDKEQPKLECPVDMDKFVDAGTRIAVVDFEIPTAEDNADRRPSVDCNPLPFFDFEIGTTMVTCHAEDNSRNSKECTFNVKVTDNEKPSVTCPDEMKGVSTDKGERYATVTYDLTPATDNADDAPTFSCDKPSGSQFPLGPSTVECTAKDKYGNSKTCSFPVKVIDDEKPKMNCLKVLDKLTDSGQAYSTVIYDLPSVEDNADPNPSVTCEKSSGSKFYIMPNVVLCTARDDAGNTATCTFQVHVTDEEKPTVTCPVDMTSFLDTEQPYSTVVYEKPSGDDNVDPSPSVTCNPAPNSQISQLGPNTFKCTVVDNSQNSDECEFTVTVKDNQKPKITCPLVIQTYVDAGQAYAFITYVIPEATENTNVDPVVKCFPPPDNNFQIGKSTVTCTATDASNNKNSCEFPVIVVDDEPPTLDCISTSIAQNTDSGKAYATVNYPLPTAKDNADQNPTVICNKPPGYMFPTGQNTVSCLASDNEGNQASCEISVIVTDKEEPSLTCQGPMAEFTDLGQKYSTVAYDEPKATDNIEEGLSVDCEPKSNSQFDIGINEVVCTATDLAGNIKRCKFLVRVDDNEKPTLTCPVSMNRSADQDQKYTRVSYIKPRGQDNSGVEPAIICFPLSELFYIGKTTLTCTATDDASNKESCSFTITVTDDEKPKLTCPEPMKRTMDPGADYATIKYTIPTAFDNMDQNLVVTCEPGVESRLSLATHKVSCQASDNSGNTGTCSFTVRVTDEEAPKFDCPASMSEDTDPRVSTYTANYIVPEATDNVDDSVEVTCIPALGIPLGIGETSVTCTAKDSAGNIKTCPFSITVEDNELPEYECFKDMPDITVDPGQAYATIIYPSTEVTDNVDSNLPIVCSKTSDFQFPIGRTDVECTATDTAGNKKECLFFVKVKDDEEPKMECPVDMDIETNPQDRIATVSYTLPTATDSVDGEVTVVCDPASGSPLNVGTATITCTAIDSAQNIKTCPFKVLVQDKEEPQFECPKSMNDLSTDKGVDFAIINYELPAVFDNVDEDIQVTCEKAPDSQFLIGKSTVTCTSTDDAGNKNLCFFTIEVKDKEAPQLTCPDAKSQNTDLGKRYATVVYETAVANDNADSDLVVNCNLPSGSQFFIEVDNTVVCTAIDKYKNMGECNFTVTVTDEEKPTITCLDSMEGIPTDRRVDYATVEYEIPTGYDNADGSPVVSCVKPPGSQFSIGENTITCTVTDKNQNSNECKFTIGVIDAEKPRITCPIPMFDVTTDDSIATANVIYELPTAIDNVDPNLTITCLPLSNTPFKIGSTLVKCKALDKTGNKKGCNFEVFVTDDEKPTMTCPEPMVKSTDLGKNFATVEWRDVAAEDNVDSNLVVTCLEPSGSEFSLGQTTVECSVSDIAGNEETCSFTIDVSDDEKPVLDCPIAMSEPVDPGEDFAKYTYPDPIVSDNADNEPDVDCQPPTGSELSVGPNQITCTANDEAGNENTCDFTVTIKDNEGPTIKCPMPMPKSADQGTSSTTVTYDDPEVSDNNDDDPTATCTPASNTKFEIGNNEVRCIATDSADNTNECKFLVVVKDSEAPDLTCLDGFTQNMDPGSSTASVPYEIPVAKDNWDDSPLVTCLPAPNSVFNEGPTQVVCTAVDQAHNKNNCSFYINVEDKEKPEVTCPDSMDEVVDPGESFATVDYEIPTANDNADPRPKVRCNLKPETQFEIGSNVVTCRAKDVSLNVQKCTFNITVTDNELPVFTCPVSMPSVSVDSGQDFATVQYSLNPVEDNADPAPTVACDPPADSPFELGPTQVNCRAEDKYGNFRDCTFHVTVIDDEAPKFDCPVFMKVSTDLDKSTAAVSYEIPTATDNADDEVLVTCTPAPDTLFGVGETNVTCTATDSNSNTKICPFTIKVEDKEDPTFDCPDPMPGLSADPGQAYAVVQYILPDADDNVDKNIKASCLPAPSSKFPIGTNDVTCAATDTAKNSKRCTFSIEVKDEEAPKYACPSSMDKYTDLGSSTAKVFYSLPTATDNADGNLQVTCNPAPDSLFPVGETTVQCSIEDIAGNPNDCSFTITVTDEEKPQITCPDPMIDIPNDAGKKVAIVSYTVPSANDNVDGLVEASCVKGSGSEFPIGKTVVRCSARDVAGNTGECTFSVTVKDTEKPKFVCPGDIRSNTDKGVATAGASYIIPIATDNVDGSVTVTCTPALGEPLTVGSNEIKCTATDLASNTETCPFYITVDDKEDPEFECPSDMDDVKVEAGKDFGIGTYTIPKASDNVDNNVQVLCIERPGSQFKIGRSEVTCTARDEAGNSKHCSFFVDVKDDEKPKFDCPVSMIVPTTAGTSSAVISYTLPTATDNADGTAPVTCNPAPDSKMEVGMYPGTCRAEDSAGNTKECSFQITVEDREAPKYECPVQMNVNTDKGENYATVNYELPTVIDNVDSGLQVTCYKPSGSQFAIGTAKVSCSVRDTANNVKNCDFYFDVIDNEAPEFECPVKMLETTDPGVATYAAAYTVPMADDNVDGPTYVTCLPTPGTKLRVGENIVECTASDLKGNTKTCDFPITVEDKEKPDFVCPPEKKGVSVDPGKNFATVDYTLPDVTDNVDCSTTLVVSCVKPPKSQFPIGTSPVECTATDMAGNSKMCTFDIEVIDDEAPKLVCPYPMTKGTDPTEATAIVEYTVPTAMDNVDGNVDVICKPGSGELFQVGTTQVTCTAVDSNSNKKTCPFFVTVEDREAPVITCPDSMENQSPNQGQTYATIIYILPEAEDNKDASPVINCDKLQSYQFPIGITTVECTATDDASNSNKCSFTIEVKDTTPPTVFCPKDMTFDSPAKVDFVVSRDTSATDDDGTTKPVTCEYLKETFANGPNGVTCRATDASENEGICTFNIIIDPPLCEFPTEANDYNIYKECASPLTPDGLTKICIRGTSSYSMFVAVWFKQELEYTPEFIDLTITDDMLRISQLDYSNEMPIVGFSSGEPKLCVQRTPDGNLIILNDNVIYTAPAGGPSTEVGFASSDNAMWVVQPYFGPIESRRRRRSVDDVMPLRKAVSRRRRSADGDELKVRSKMEKRRR